MINDYQKNSYISDDQISLLNPNYYLINRGGH